MNITLKEREIKALTLLRATPVHTAVLARELGVDAGNMTVLVRGMVRNGYIESQEVEPESRVGYRHGEKRKVWHVTSTGIMAESLYMQVLHTRDKAAARAS